MRLGKKRDHGHGHSGSGSEGARGPHSVDGITRLICLSKAQTPLRGEASARTTHSLSIHSTYVILYNFPLAVYIDGLEWQGVKFFQLSSQWQTHIKVLPVATMGPCDGHDGQQAAL